MAGRQARKETLDALKKSKTSLYQTIKQLNALSEAKKISAHYDNEDGWQYSEALTDNPVRLKAVDLKLQLFDAYPPKRQEVTGKDGDPIEITTDAGPGLQAVMDRIANAIGIRTEENPSMGGPE